VAPGTNAAGTLNYTGDCEMSGLADLEIELGGTAVGTEYDVLAVLGTSVLDGTLELSLISGFTPNVLDVFTILTTAGGTLSGVFENAASQVNFPDGSFDVTYTPNSVFLSNFVPIPEPSTAMLVLAGIVVLASRRRIAT